MWKHWNYWEFSKCFPGCLGCFFGYSLSMEFYSNSTWWLGGRWQQDLVVTDRMALDDFAVSIVQVFSIGHRVLLLISSKVSQASNAHKHWKFFMPMPKDNRDVTTGRRTLPWSPYVFWSESCNTWWFCGNVMIYCLTLLYFKVELVKLRAYCLIQSADN